MASWLASAVAFALASTALDGDAAWAVAGMVACATFVGMDQLTTQGAERLAGRLAFTRVPALTIGTKLLLAALGAALAAACLTNPWLAPFAVAPLLLLRQWFEIPQLEHQAKRDAKTGLFNARYFELAVERELEDAKTRQGPMSVLLADLDHLREINNAHGHLAGDDVLRASDVSCWSSCARATFLRASGERSLRSCSPTRVAARHSRSPNACAALWRPPGSRAERTRRTSRRPCPSASRPIPSTARPLLSSSIAPTSPSTGRSSRAATASSRRRSIRRTRSHIRSSSCRARGKTTATCPPFATHLASSLRSWLAPGPIPTARHVRRRGDPRRAGAPRHQPGLVPHSHAGARRSAASPSSCSAERRCCKPNGSRPPSPASAPSSSAEEPTRSRR